MILRFQGPNWIFTHFQRFAQETIMKTDLTI